jgi:type I restriction enzyme M protein
MASTDTERTWYFNEIQRLDPAGSVVAVDQSTGRVVYRAPIRCDESLNRAATGEELVRAVAIAILVKELSYPADRLYIERYYKHGHPSSKQDEIDLLILDADELPYAMWEFKSSSEYGSLADEFIRYQLFGTAPLVGAPKLLVYATVAPAPGAAALDVICVDYTQYPSFESWEQSGRPHSTEFPEAYSDPTYEPLVHGGTKDLRLDATQADFRAAAVTFHAEFFGEHPDNTLFTNLMKCLLAKIYDERQTKSGEAYGFQVLRPAGRDEPALSVFQRVNKLYTTAYLRYIESAAGSSDEINPNEFGPERVKTIVKVLQHMSITRGAALHGDVIGAFFEEILRTGFNRTRACTSLIQTSCTSCLTSWT